MKKQILAMVSSICLLCTSFSVSFAAADPKETSVTLMKWQNGTSLPVASSQAELPSTLLEVVDKALVDSNASEGDYAVQMAYKDEEGNPKAGRGVGWWTLTDDAALGKHASFDLYIPGYDFYGNLRGAYTATGGARYLRNGATEILNVMEFDVKGASGNVTLKIYEGDLSTLVETVSLNTEQWYSVDMFFCDEEVYYYIDDSYVGKGTITPSDKIDTSAGHSHGFQGFQLLPGKNGGTDIYDEKAGVYFDNIKLSTYDYVSPTFCGTVNQDGSLLTVDFNEKPKEGQSVEDVKVYNTESGEEAGISTPVLEGDTMTITITGNLTTGVEYMIDMPENFVSIRDKELYSDIYFIGAALPYTVNFEKLAADIETVENGTVTAITSNFETGSSGYRFGNVAVADKSWITNHLFGIKDLSATESEHGNVLVARNIPDNPRLNQDVSFGVLKIDKYIDLTQGPATLEFEMKIPSLNSLYYMYMEPYSGNENYKSVQTEVNPVGIASAGHVHKTANTQYAQVYTPSAQGVKFNMRTDGKIVGGGKYDNNNAYVHSAEYTEGSWAKVKLELSEADGSYTAKLYVDDSYVGSVTDVYGDEKTEMFRGIRFILRTQESVETYTDLVYFDNFKFSSSASAEKVSKVRIYNRDGEEFGMLSDGIKGSAANADVFFGGEVDASAAEVLLTDVDGNTITSTYEPNDDENKLEVKFDSLLKPKTEYTLTVTGLMNSAGDAISDYSAKFTTSDEEEFEVIMSIVDDEGNEITDVANLSLNDKVYVKADVINTTSESKTVAFTSATYNDNAMSDVGIKEFIVNSGEMLTLDNNSEDAVYSEVKSTTDIKVSAFAWDSFSKIRPLITAIKY